MIVLRVALFPEVPDRIEIFHKLEAVYEREHLGVNLELVEDENALKGYYEGGLLKVSADVYEIDTLFLRDMIAAGKIGPIDLPDLPFTGEAKKAVEWNGDDYGVPHWLCGNFLFYKKGDKEIEDAESWEVLFKVLEKETPPIILDLKGKSTLGGWYLSFASQILGMEPVSKQIMNDAKPNDMVVTLIRKIADQCKTDICRNEKWHKRSASFPEAFIDKKARAYIGYSESLHYALKYQENYCQNTGDCLKFEEIAVRNLPKVSGQVEDSHLGWVDALAIRKDLFGVKRELAESFIRFMVSERAYDMILKPEEGRTRPYLLPARRMNAVDEIPLYPELYKAQSGRKSGTLPKLNEKLRALGAKLDCVLSKSPDDAESLKQCYDPHPETDLSEESPRDF